MLKYSSCFAAGVFLIALTACGGAGSGSGGGTLPAPGTPVSTPTPAPTGPPHPSAAGDTFAYNGSMTRTDSYTYPAPSPLPSTSAQATITQNVSVYATANPLGSGTTQDFHMHEADAYPAQTVTSTSDYYYEPGASAFSLLGYNSVDEGGNSTTMTYAAPQILDQLPETAGAAWSNSPAGTLTQTYADGTASTQTINADGSYTDTEQLYGSGTNYPSVKAVVTENADGSGLFRIVYYENGRQGFFPNEVITQDYAVSAVSAQSSNAQFITVNSQMTKSYAGAPTPAPPVLFASMPVWYAAPLVLHSESDKDAGTQTIPPSCQTPAAFGTQATQLQQIITDVDTVMGTTTTTSATSYVVSGFGAVCVLLNGSIKTYFDYSRDTTSGPVYFQGTSPLQTTAISQMLTLAPQGRLPQVRGVSTASGATAIPAAAIGVARASLSAQLRRDRSARFHAIAKNLVNAQLMKGLK